MFKNISNQNDTRNYLPIFLSSIIVYILSIIYISYFDNNKKKNLRKFYDNFNIGVIFTDLLLLVISLNRSRFLYNHIFTEYTLQNFLLTSVLIQLTYDLFLSDLYNLIPRNSSLYFSIFRTSNKILKIPVIITNIVTHLLVILFASYLANFNDATNINLLLSLLSFIPYLIYFVK